MTEPVDALIVGAGPAGLTAALYLARYHLRVRVIDSGDSRAEWIPLSHNHAGYPEGISGHDLIARMRAQAERYGVRVERGEVTSLARADEGFTAESTVARVATRSVLLATGVVNRGPPMPDDEHDAALMAGLLRYCPICDGYEASDKAIAVLGRGARGPREALFLRSFSARVTLVDIDGDPGFDADRTAELADAGIAVVHGPVDRVRAEGGRIRLTGPMVDLAFDTLYPALGSDVRAGLAQALGVRLAGDSCVVVDDHMRTGLIGLYAAGDMVKGLDQISNAMGQAAVAATTIRNDIAAGRRLWR